MNRRPFKSFAISSWWSKELEWSKRYHEIQENFSSELNCTNQMVWNFLIWPFQFMFHMWNFALLCWNVCCSRPTDFIHDPKHSHFPKNKPDFPNGNCSCNILLSVIQLFCSCWTTKVMGAVVFTSLFSSAIQKSSCSFAAIAFVSNSFVPVFPLKSTKQSMGYLWVWKHTAKETKNECGMEARKCILRSVSRLANC